MLRVAMTVSELHILIGWIAILLGVISGAVIGLFFHVDGWAGGYDSFRRRLLRLGHISFFGLGFLNLLFSITIMADPWPIAWIGFASAGFITGVITMPICCFLTAWKMPFRYLFPIPVLAVLVGIAPVIIGWVFA